MEPVSTEGPLHVFVGGRRDAYVDYCRKRDLNPNRHVHVTKPEHLHGIHAPHVKVAHGDTSFISDGDWVAIVALLGTLRSGTPVVEEEERSA